MGFFNFTDLEVEQYYDVYHLSTTLCQIVNFVSPIASLAYVYICIMKFECKQNYVSVSIQTHRYTQLLLYVVGYVCGMLIGISI